MISSPHLLPSCAPRIRRWLEYSGSASIMAVLLALSIGIREQNTLALIFTGMYVTQWLGFMTELYVFMPELFHFPYDSTSLLADPNASGIVLELTGTLDQ